MRIAGFAIVLACGVMSLIGLFLPWISKSIFFLSSSMSGYGLTDFGMTNVEFTFSFIEPYLVIAGSMLVIFCALPALINAIVNKSERRLTRVLSIGIAFGSLLSLIGILWFVARHATSSESWAGYGMAYGFYLSTAGTIIALIIGIYMSICIHRARHGAETDEATNGISIARPVSVLLLGTTMAVGVFLPWMSTAIIDIPLIFSGWGLAEFGNELIIEPSFIEVYFVLAGGILLGLSASLACITKTNRKKMLSSIFNFVAKLGAALAILGISWLLIHAGYGIEDINFEPWLCVTLIAAVLGLLIRLTPVPYPREINLKNMVRKPANPAIFAFFSLPLIAMTAALAIANMGCPVHGPVINYVPPGLESLGRSPFGWQTCWERDCGDNGYFSTDRYEDGGDWLPSIMLSYFHNPWLDEMYSSDDDALANILIEHLLNQRDNRPDETGSLNINGAIAGYAKYKYYGNSSDAEEVHISVEILHEQTYVRIIATWNTSDNGEQEVMSLINSITFDE